MAEQTTVTAAREDAYRLLAACYYTPTPAFFEEECIANLAALLTGVDPEAAAHATDAIKLLQKTSFDQLLVDHTRLFVGPFELPAPPYGSVWLEQEKSLMGTTTMKAVKFYDSCGLHLAEDLYQVPDHISVELEFISFLAFKQREASLTGNQEEVRRYIDLQQEFLATFMLPWLTPFTAAVISDGHAPFYVALAKCTAAFIAADYQGLTNA